MPGVGDELFESFDADRIQSQQDQRPILVAPGGEEQIGLAEQQRLPFGLVSDVEHRNINANLPSLAGDAFRIRPDETLVATRKSKPSDGISSTDGKASAIRRTSSASATTAVCNATDAEGSHTYVTLDADSDAVVVVAIDKTKRRRTPSAATAGARTAD